MQERELATAFASFRDRSDMRALARVFDATAPQMLAVARHLARSREDADDLVQATFLTAIERAATYDESRAFVPWLAGILALHACKQRERAGRALDVSRTAPRANEEPDAHASSRELAAAVERAVATMPATYASVVRRHLVEGVGPGEIAGELGITPANARVRLHRGLKLLRASIPSGFAGVALGWLTSWRSLRALRGEVLARASAKTGAAIPSSIAVTPLVIAALAVVALSAPAWWPAVRPTPGGAAVDSNATAAAASSTSNAAGDERATSIATAAQGAREAAASAPVVAPSASGTGRTIRGRLLLPSGSPAAGARVALSVPKLIATTWQPPPPVATDIDGRFEITCEPQPGLFTLLTASLARHATMQWHWNDLAREPAVDLGDATFERAGTLTISLADALGVPQSKGWRVELFDASESRRGKQDMISRQASLTPAGTATFDDLAPRRYRVRATRGVIGEVPWTVTDVAEDRASELRLAYDGPDPERRIGLEVHLRAPAKAHDLDASHVKLMGPDGREHATVPLPRTPGRFVFEDVDGGGYELAIDDPSLSAFSRSGISAGDSLDVDLAGAASIALHVRGADGREIADYSLSAMAVEPNMVVTPVKLRSPSAPAPERSIYPSFLPGDVRLDVAIAGAPEKSVLVQGLRAGEVRDVEVLFAGGLALAGRALEQDGARPAGGVAIELTRGSVAASANDNMTVVVVRSGASSAPAAATSTVTAADGTFRFESLDAGEWTVSARWNALLSAERTIQLTNASSPAIELVQPACGWFEGVAASNQRVSARGVEFDAQMRSVEADVGADGRFRLGPLPVGRYLVDASAKREPGSGWGTGQRSLTTFSSFGAEPSAPTYAIAAERATELDLRTAPQSASVRVRVAIEGGSVVGASVVAKRMDSASRSVHALVGSDVDAEGVVTLHELPPGSYVFVVSPANGAWAWERAEPLELRAGATAEVELAVRLARRELRVVDGDGAALAFASLTWATGNGSSEAHGSTLEHGEIALVLPQARMRFECAGRALEPSEVEWRAGEAPIVLRATKRP